MAMTFSPDITSQLCADILSAVFLYAGYRKLSHSRDFGKVLAELRIGWLSVPIRTTLPVIEVLVGAGLLLEIAPIAAAVAAFALLLTFAVVATLVSLKGESVSCSCFGPGDSTLGVSMSIRNGFLAACALRLMLVPHGVFGFREASLLLRFQLWLLAAGILCLYSSASLLLRQRQMTVKRDNV